MCFMHLMGCRILLTLCTDFVLFSWESVVYLQVCQSNQSMMFKLHQTPGSAFSFFICVFLCFFEGQNKGCAFAHLS